MSCVLIAFVFAHPILSFTRLEPKPPVRTELSCRDTMHRERVEKHHRQVLDEAKKFEAVCEIQERVKDYWRFRTPQRIRSHAIDLLASKPGLVYHRSGPRSYASDSLLDPFRKSRDLALEPIPTGLQHEKK